MSKVLNKVQESPSVFPFECEIVTRTHHHTHFHLIPMGNHQSDHHHLPHLHIHTHAPTTTSSPAPPPAPDTPASSFIKRLEETPSVANVPMSPSTSHLTDLKSHFYKSYPNGLLTIQEFTRENRLLHPNTPISFWETLFQFLDADENGFLDLREYLIAYSLMNTEAPKDTRLEFWFELLDRDASGELSLEECEYLFGVLMGMADAIGVENQGTEECINDTVESDVTVECDVDSSESDIPDSQKREYRVSCRITDMFRRMDANSDGKVTYDEFRKAAQNDALLKHLLNIEIDHQRQQELHKAMHVNPKDFELQVGGHGSEKQLKKTSMPTTIITKTNDFLFKRRDRRQSKDAIIKTDDKIWKPLEKREFAFYEYVYHATRDTDPLTSKLRQFMPKYYGRTFVDYEDPSPRTVYYLILEDCTHGMSKRACIADLKIGTKGHDSQASLKKRAQQIALCEMTSSRKLGFRFCGYKKWDVASHSVSTLSKFQGGLLHSTQVSEHLEQFINNGERVRYHLYKKALEQLVAIRDWFRVQKRYSFYSSSILLCYDGESDNDDSMVVKMIDFAHVEIDQKEKDLDRSYLTGIEKLVELIEQIVERHERTGEGTE